MEIEGGKMAEETIQAGEMPAAAPSKKKHNGQYQAQKYWLALVGKRIKITPMVAGLPPITGVLKSVGVYEVEIELQNRTVYVMKHAIYTVEEAPEPIIGTKKK